MTSTGDLDPMKDDALLTAYALGELNASARAVVEARLATDAAARALVDEIRATADVLTSALATEASPGLTPEQKAAVVRAAPRPDPAQILEGRPVHRLRSGWRKPAPVAIAAGVLLALGGAALALRSLSGAREQEMARAMMEGSPPAAGSSAAPAGGDMNRMKGGTMTVKQILDDGDSVEDLKLRRRFEAAGRKTGGRGVQDAGAPAGGPPPPGVVHRGVADEVEIAQASNIAGARLRLAGDTDGQPVSSEAYDYAKDNGFVRVADEPLSTFSLDVDTAAYANLRRMIVAGQLPPPGAVRVEEMLNYFPYRYDPPAGGAPFRVHLEVAACPWNLEHRLVRIGVKAREVERAGRPASNLVFLIDVSGSMNEPNKLPLVKASLRMLLDELNERDRVAIVVYAGASGLVLPSTSCERKAEIQDAIDTLTPGGSTNGAAGIGLAYEIATKEFLAGGTNRVVLCTDGDWNVGTTSQDELVRLIEEKAKSKVFLTVLGFGMGNYKDSMLVKLADKGNGNYGYIDTTREAHKVLVEQAAGTLVTVAKDVKVQVEFNPAKVGAYRLIGYEKRLLAKQDFNDDTKDAGEIGAGHTVTALYEIAPPGHATGTPEVDPLRYQGMDGGSAGSGVPSEVVNETLAVKVRYKEPAADASQLLVFPLTDGGARYESASADYKFQAAVAAFGMLLRKSAFAGTASFDAVIELAGEGVSDDPGGYRREFVDLVSKAKALSAPK